MLRWLIADAPLYQSLPCDVPPSTGAEQHAEHGHPAPPVCRAWLGRTDHTTPPAVLFRSPAMPHSIMSGTHTSLKRKGSKVTRKTLMQVNLHSYLPLLFTSIERQKLFAENPFTAISDVVRPK